MKRLISSMLLPALTMSCASKGTYSTSDIGERFSVQESPRPWSPNLAAMRSTLKKDSKLPIEKQIFNFYCSQGHQTRALKTKIHAVISRPPTGAPVDEAALIQSKKRQLIQDQIQNFYRTLFLEDGLTRSGFGQETELNEFFATEAKSNSEFIAKSKTPTEACDSGCVSIVSFDQDFQLILSFGLRRYQTQYVREKFLIPKYLLVGTDTNLSGFVSANKQTVNAFTSSSAEEATEHRTMTDLYFIEKILAQKFTMLIPAAVQESIFGSPKFFISNADQFSIRESIDSSQLKKLWSAYLSKFTTYKESQSPDPQILDYEVELDLKPLCSYGRAIDDLISK